MSAVPFSNDAAPTVAAAAARWAGAGADPSVTRAGNYSPPPPRRKWLLRGDDHRQPSGGGGGGEGAGSAGVECVPLQLTTLKYLLNSVKGDRADLSCYVLSKDQKPRIKRQKRST